MAIRRVGDEDLTEFDKAPEVAMDLHIGKYGDRYVLVIGGRIVVEYDGELMGSFAEFNAIAASRDRGEDIDSYGQRLEAWRRGLPVASGCRPVPREEASIALGFIHLGPHAPLPVAPPPPSVIYGHLPFSGICSGTDVFYRYERLPTSRRIDRSTNTVKFADIYGCPPRELQYIASGLGVVARYALPSLFPACWRYELTPPSGTLMKYGASVPLYGQSGGGVEVLFPSPFKNAVAIPPPASLPIF